MPRSDATLDDRVRLLKAARRSVLIQAIIDDSDHFVRPELLRDANHWKTSELVNYCLYNCVPVPGVPDGR